MGMYCTQFRQRVLADCESGMTIAEAARKWNITRKTIYDWKKLLEKTVHSNQVLDPVGRDVSCVLITT